ncbi:aminotransferase family protein [Streptomyces sp. SP17KL33]|uniref:aminotransferase family protein n=1 Tax=Streptomyces sp. SP17KL33 TaxID=3002534 RepID=UPI002E760DA8|nr:aspartate aminotransferase family protein [Streptomyces sp. SP17KL33]MEE1831702.1 aspartate aminotransferase family protein [Streptomyces sp. SP17KL33]
MSKSVLLSAHQPMPPVDYTHAKGAWVHTADGRRLLDASSGLVCVNIGHAHPHVIERMAQQAAVATYASSGTLRPVLQEELAVRLTSAVGREGDGVSLACSGTSAVELAISYARLIQRARGHADKHHILTASLGYHGNSGLTLGLSGHRRRRPEPADAMGLGPAFDPPYPGHHRNCRFDVCRDSCVESVRTAILERGPDTVAAVLIEPVNGTTGGAYTPPPDYLGALRRLCDEFEVLVVHDEVLTGLGRTGLPLGADYDPAGAADIVVLSKGLSAGYVPLSAVLVNESGVATLRSMDRPLPLMGTMSASPLQAAVGLAVLDVLQDIGALDPGKVRGVEVTAAVRALADLPAVVRTRGVGYFHAVELVSGAQRAALTLGREAGLLLYPFNGFNTDGSGEGVVIAPPLNVTAEEIGFLADASREALGRIPAR